MDIMQLANKAAAVAVIRLDRPPTLKEADFEDLRQEAALAIWRNLERGERYAFVAGRNAAILHWIRDICGSNPNAGVLPNWQLHGEVGEGEDLEGLPDEVVLELVKIFIEARARGGERTLKAAIRDAQIVALLCQGYSVEGIAQELGIPGDHVSVYRSKIKKVLAAYAAEHNISIPEEEDGGGYRSGRAFTVAALAITDDAHPLEVVEGKGDEGFSEAALRLP